MLLIVVLLFNFVFLSTQATCPPGSTPFFKDKSHCLIFQTNKTYYMDAEEICINLGGHLVSVHDSTDNMFLSQQALVKFTDSTDSDFWFGANDLSSPQKWAWMDDTPFDYSNWDKGQPQNISDNYCGAVLMHGGKWKSDDCYKVKPFVCMISVVDASTNILSTTTTKITITTTTKPKTCEKEWTAFDGFCYKVFDPRTWYEAEQMCVTEKAHLASIHNTQEALFVANLAYYSGSDACDGSKQAWIGLFADDNFKNYKWTDDTPFDYQKWGSGQPYQGATNYCTVLSLAPVCGDITGVFYANSCDTFNAKSVCKKQPS